ncbi:MAG TPA: GuaB3 family IMP dehydrogenase-related protein [Dehalococcoidia bacterium]|nr:GuaB3 family IMP dehydrogenase-related protein [Dehalococcoidia bacterium]
MEYSQYKKLRQTYGFEEIAIVPGDITINPDQTDVSLVIERLNFPIPILASAMDGVVDVRFAIAMSKLGGLAVLNLEGLQTRYADPEGVLDEIANEPPEKVTQVLQRIYSEPIKDNLIGDRIKAIKDAGGVCAVSLTPANTKRMSPLAAEAGMDILVVQSTVTTARHMSKSYRGLIFSELVKQLPVPVIVGNCVSYSACRKLMETGIHGVLVGVGPGAACTTREVIGVGVPQAAATMDCAAARDDYFRASGRYIPIVTDGGIRNGGDLCKAFACGADGVMLGSIFAQTEEAPGRGNHWGMATPHEALPRGTRIRVAVNGSLEQTLFGPTSVTNGTQNLVGALRTSMGVCGARNVREMHQAEIVIAPSIKTEGKGFQYTQGLAK